MQEESSRRHPAWEVTMKWHTKIHAGLLRKLALFLEEHPGFWPELVGEDALVCGFHVGGCSLTIDEMEKLVTTEVQL
jgi:hypothetical protein